MGAVPLARRERAEFWEGLGTGALVEKAQTGDARAFEALYRRLVGRIYALCLRMARDAQRAEELTQDVFVRAWERLGSFRGESEFTTWLHRLAVNVVLQEGRAKGRRESREESVADPGEYLGRVREEFPGYEDGPGEGHRQPPGGGPKSGGSSRHPRIQVRRDRRDAGCGPGDGKSPDPQSTKADEGEAQRMTRHMDDSSAAGLPGGSVGSGGRGGGP